MGLCPSTKRRPRLRYPLLTSDFYISAPYEGESDELETSFAEKSPKIHGSLQFSHELEQQNKESEMFFSTNTNESQDKINHLLEQKINSLHKNTQENFKLISDDIHTLHDELRNYRLNHHESFK